MFVKLASPLYFGFSSHLEPLWDQFGAIEKSFFSYFRAFRGFVGAIREPKVGLRWGILYGFEPNLMLFCYGLENEKTL